MSLKGVCSIELRDSDGNIVQKTEDENMVTNYLSNLVNPNIEVLKNVFDKEMSIDFQDALYPLIDKVIGGVLLFGDTIEENADFKIPYAPLVGHASSIYAYNIPTRGAFNQNESTTITNANGKILGYKYVWDFATEKANGTIKCAALTTGKFGDKGYLEGNDKIHKYMFACPVNRRSNVELDALNVFKTTTGNCLYSSESISGKSYVYLYYYDFNNYHRLVAGDNSKFLIGNFDEGDYIYATSMTNNSLTLAHYAVNYSLGLADKRTTMEDRLKKISEKVISFDRNVFSISGSVLNSSEMAIGKIYTDESYIYVTGAEKNSIYLYKVDPKTFDILESKFENLDIPNIVTKSVNGYAQGCAYYDGYYYIPQLWDSEENGNYRYKLRILAVNSENVSEYQSICTLYSTDRNYNSIAPLVYSVYDKLLFISYSINNAAVSIYKNKYIQQFAGPIPLSFKDFKFPHCFVKGNGSYTTYSYGYGVCTHGLITIDNLSTPIIKNSTQTMKITYEITEVDETV